LERLLEHRAKRNQFHIDGSYGSQDILKFGRVHFSQTVAALRFYRRTYCHHLEVQSFPVDFHAVHHKFQYGKVDSRSTARIPTPGTSIDFITAPPKRADFTSQPILATR
jgi:hypothetical protein